MKRAAHWLNLLERPAYYLDLYRVVPRAVLSGYGWMAWRVAEWFLTLPNPTLAQAGFPSVVYGVAPLVLNFYMQNGVDWERRRGTPVPQPAASLSAVATVSSEPPVKGG
jgi:hypothetical protein